MTPIRIETMIESVTLHLPQLQPLVGKSVEILVREMPPETARAENHSSTSPLAGSVLEYINPFEYAAPPADWEASR